MRAVLTALMSAALLAAMAPPVAAQTPTDKADVRCILVLTVAAREPKNTSAAQQGVFYFVGKIDGHAMTGKLDGLMVSESKALNSKEAIQQELTRCGAELNQRSNALRAMSQRLQAANPPPPRPAAK